MKRDSVFFCVEGQNVSPIIALLVDLNLVQAHHNEIVHADILVINQFTPDQYAIAEIASEFGKQVYIIDTRCDQSCGFSTSQIEWFEDLDSFENFMRAKFPQKDAVIV